VESSTFASTICPASGRDDHMFTSQSPVSSSKVASFVSDLAGYRLTQSATFGYRSTAAIASFSVSVASPGLSCGTNGTSIGLPFES
jgi:hypothetical protein